MGIAACQSVRDNLGRRARGFHERFRVGCSHFFGFFLVLKGGTLETGGRLGLPDLTRSFFRFLVPSSPINLSCLYIIGMRCDATVFGTVEVRAPDRCLKKKKN